VVLHPAALQDRCQGGMQGLEGLRSLPQLARFSLPLVIALRPGDGTSRLGPTRIWAFSFQAL
jgi:hypothetical protein